MFFKVHTCFIEFYYSMFFSFNVLPQFIAIKELNVERNGKKSSFIQFGGFWVFEQHNGHRNN